MDKNIYDEPFTTRKLGDTFSFIDKDGKKKTVQKSHFEDVPLSVVISGIQITGKRGWPVTVVAKGNFQILGLLRLKNALNNTDNLQIVYILDKGKPVPSTSWDVTEDMLSNVDVTKLISKRLVNKLSEAANSREDKTEA